MESITREFIDECSYRLEKSRAKLAECLGRVSEAQIWERPNEASNSIGNLILHLCGNMRQYIISGIGGEADHRERDKEFSARETIHRSGLLELLNRTVSEAIRVVRGANDETLLKKYEVQGFTLSGVGIVIHVTEHFSHHTGQVIFWTKQLIKDDLGFYAGVDLNKHNSK